MMYFSSATSHSVLRGILSINLSYCVCYNCKSLFNAEKERIEMKLYMNNFRTHLPEKDDFKPVNRQISNYPENYSWTYLLALAGVSE